MPSEVSTVTGEQSVEALRRELAEARVQQAATVEILASISSSVTDANQVFAKIAASAVTSRTPATAAQQLRRHAWCVWSLDGRGNPASCADTLHHDTRSAGEELHLAS